MLVMGKVQGGGSNDGNGVLDGVVGDDGKDS